MKIFSGTSNQTLSKLIFNLLKSYTNVDIDLNMDKLIIEKFKDNEILPRFMESVRYEDVFFIQSTNTSDSIIETLLVIDAAKRSGCKSFTLVAPFQGYSRQDKTDHIRSSIGSKMMADILEKVGISSLITIDLHNSAIQASYNVPVIHLNGNKIFIDYIKSLNLDNICICAPDHGALKKNTNFGRHFTNDLAIIDKKRVKPNEVSSMSLIGDVKGKNIIIVDDMTDTSGTLCKASDLLFEKGALSVRAIATHGILSHNAIENISKSSLTELLVSDTIESVYHKSSICPKIKVISSSYLLADSIYRISVNRSINDLNE